MVAGALPEPPPPSGRAAGGFGEANAAGCCARKIGARAGKRRGLWPGPLDPAP